jgi:hypothetical protein
VGPQLIWMLEKSVKSHDFVGIRTPIPQPLSPLLYRLSCRGSRTLTCSYILPLAVLFVPGPSFD